MGAFLVWLAVTAALFAGLLAWRGSHLHRRLRLADIHWKAAVLLATLLALVPAFVFDYLSRDEVDIPPGVAERDRVPAAPPSEGE